MVEIPCLVCKEPLKIPPCIDPDDYDGQLFCHNCNLLWDVKLKSSKPKKYKLAKQQPEVKGGSISINFVPAKKKEKDNNKEE